MAERALATAFVNIVPGTSNFDSMLRQQLNGKVPGIGAQAGASLGSNMKSKFGAAIRGLAGPLIAAVGAQQIGSFLKDAVSSASDVAEQGAAVGQVFGAGAKAIQDFAKGAATSLGQSQVSILEAAKSFGIYGKAAGLAGADNADFSKNLVGLATDLASFNNTSVDEALLALQSGLRGESEPLRKYGVLLDDASLKQEALKQGIIKTTKGSLTPQQRVLAANALIFKQTATQQGDFTRTSGGLANQQRILSASFANVKTSIGTLLLPAMTSIVTGLNKSVIPALQTGADKLPALFAGAGQALKPIFDGFGPIFQTLGEQFGPLIPQIITLATSFSPLGLAFKALAPLIPQVVGVLGGTLAQVLSVVVPLVSQLAGIVSNYLAVAFTTLAPILMDIIQQVAAFLIPVFQQIAPLLLQVGQFVGDLVIAIMPLIASILGLVKPLITLLKPVLTIIIGLLKFLLPPIMAIIKVLVAILVPIIKFVVDAFGAWITVLGTIYGAFVSAFSSVPNFFKGIVNGLIGLLEGFLNFWIDGINGLLGTVNDVGGFLSDITGGAINVNVPLLPKFNLPRLAKGGYVNQPTTALIGEAGPEVVTPLKDFERMMGLDNKAKDRPIYADGVGLLGWIREEAKGQAKLVFNTELDKVSLGVR